MLSAYVQSRILKIASANSIHFVATSIDSSSTQTSPQEYRSQTSPDSPVSDSDDSLNTDVEMDGIAMLPEASVHERAHAAGDIDWKYGNQGMSLLALAASESSNITPGQVSSTLQFSRDLYVDGLTYLLRALPNDLTAEERVSIRTALPNGIAVHDSALINSEQRIAQRAPDTDPKEGVAQDVSMVHRLFAFLTIQFFVLVHCLLPYVKLLVGQAYRYERQHHISERVLRSGLDTVDSVGQRSIQMADAICKLNDGKVGQTMHEFGSWWIRGMAGGLHEGIGEGLAIMGATQNNAQEHNR